MRFVNHTQTTVLPRLGHQRELLSTASVLAAAIVISFGLADLFLPNQQAADAVTTFVVTTTADSGAGSLRQAILDANATSGLDTIGFNIPSSGVHTISPTTVLPTITDPVVIDGYTQPGSSANTLPDGDNAVLLIELNGTNLNGGAIVHSGMTINSSNCVIRGLVINRFLGGGVSITSSVVPSTNTNNTVEGNFLGTDPSGTIPLGNGDGINVTFCTNTLIGGTTPAARNVISGNGSRGISISTNASTNTIQGNFIGTNANGTGPLSNNGGGIAAGGLGNDIIGGTATGARNVISGNLNNAGIFVSYGTSNGATIQGNLIGTDVTGTVAIGNFFGIWLNFGGGGNSLIGGVAPGARNVISGNRSDGLLISLASSNNQIQSNLIGTDISGTNPLGNSGDGIHIEALAERNQIGGLAAGQGNTIAFNGRNGVVVAGSPSANRNAIRRNAIFSNAGLGIDLGDDGVTQNDSGDGDIGPNDRQNFPIITSVTEESTQTTITVKINSTPDTFISMDLYSNSVCDPSGNGEGTTPLSVAPFAVRTDSNGNANFLLRIAPALLTGHVITATATDPAGNTSEFSACNSPQAMITFSAADYTIAEDGGGREITVNRTGDINQPMTVDYATSDMTASERSDYTTAAGTLRFAAGENTKSFIVLVSLDSFNEGSELVGLTLSNPTGGVPLGVPANATLQINDPLLPPASNPIDNAQNFVRQHYHDFLSREPDPPGLVFWTNQITSCGTDAACIEIKRINVSAAFFLSIEFQQSGYLVYRTYKAAYADLPGLPVPVRFNEFLIDTQEIGKGLIVGQTGWEQLLELHKQAFTADFVSRSRFTTLYPTSLSPSSFVDALFANAGVIPTAAERTAALNEFGGAMNTADNAARARALRLIAENSTLVQQEFNKAFVLMQYFGYLRRNPNNAPDSDFSGFDFWLNKLNQFNGNFVNAEMVKAFISSGEYRSRFGSNP